jgi:AbrB family looped-hinge helix DNA binding protein
VNDLSATFTSKGQLVVPAELRRKYKIEAGTRVRFLEDQFGRIVLQPITAHYIDRVKGCLAGGPDLVAAWENDHRKEDRRKEDHRKEIEGKQRP